MDNPFQMVIDGKPANDILLAMARLSKFELDKLASKVPADHVARIGASVFEACQATGVQKILSFGGQLELYALASQEEKEPALFAEMHAQLGISRSHAYECRAVWNRFGQVMAVHNELIKRFVASSLKVLAGKSVCDAAVAEAIELAKQGEFIDIARAKEIRKKHAATDGAEDGTTTQPTVRPRPSANTQTGGGVVALAGSFAKALRVYTGRLVHVTMKPSASDKAENVDALINDLEEAITALRDRKRRLRLEEATGACHV